MTRRLCMAGAVVPRRWTGCPQRYPQGGSVTGGTRDAKVFCNDRRVNTPESALGALPNPGGEFLDLIEDLASLGHLATDLAFGVHDRGVVTAERLADLG